MAREFAGRRCDAVLTIDALAIMPEPFFVYAYTSWDGLTASAATPEKFAALRNLTPANLARRRDQQVAVYERATGIIAESRWLARSLAEQSGVSREKIYVVPPAPPVTPAQVAARGPLRARAAPRRKLLFVIEQSQSHHFYRKGGDLAVAALRLLRRDYDPQITLTVAGVDTWPMPGEPPEGVELVGRLPAAEMARLYDAHDLFVMPSRLESFGLFMVEALTRGMPCVARDAYAMPEIVTPGVSGVLVNSDDEEKLAAAIASVLTDDEIYRRCLERAPRMAEYYSWDRSAREIAEVVRQVTGTGRDPHRSH